jgi:hypothetical protein
MKYWIKNRKVSIKSRETFHQHPWKQTYRNALKTMLFHVSIVDNRINLFPLGPRLETFLRRFR